MKDYKKYLKIAALALPAVFTIVFIWHYGKNLPFLDEWDMVSLFRNPNFGGFWEPWSEHRIFFPKLIIWLWAWLTDWNLKSQMMLSVGFGLLAYYFIYKLLQRTVKGKKQFFIALICSAWLFSPVQSENWLWAWCICWFICISALLATIYYLEIKKIYHAMAGAFIATFSLGGGILVWLIGFFMTKKQRLWAIAAGFTVALYYFDYDPNRQSSIIENLKMPVAIVKYFLAMFGRPFTADLQLAMLLGTLSLLLFIPAFLYHRKSPWFFLSLFVIAANALNALVRVNAGVYNGTSSRYVTLTLLYVIAMTAMFYKSKFIYFVSVPLLIMSYSLGIKTGRMWHNQITPLYSCSHQEEVADSCIEKIHYRHDPQLDRSDLEYLQDRGWGGFNS